MIELLTSPFIIYLISSLIAVIFVTYLLEKRQK